VSLAFGICCSERISILLLLALMVTYLLGSNTSIESKQLSRYIILINSDSFDSTAESHALSKLYSDFALLLLAFVLCASQLCSSRESLLSEWTYHVFTLSTHVKCCARMPGFFNVMQTIRPNKELAWTSE